MSSLHASDVASRLRPFLTRRKPPPKLDAAAEDAERNALFAALARVCPRDPDKLRDWWPEFEAALGEAFPRNWPNEKELADLGRKMNPRPKAETIAIGSDAERFAIAMQEGRPVPEPALYGRLACEIIATGKIGEPVMRAYRSGAFLSRRSIYGEEEAKRWQAQREAAHSEAREVWKAARSGDQSEMRDLELPDKRVSGLPVRAESADF